MLDHHDLKATASATDSETHGMIVRLEQEVFERDDNLVRGNSPGLDPVTCYAQKMFRDPKQSAKLIVTDATFDERGNQKVFQISLSCTL